MKLTEILTDKTKEEQDVQKLKKIIEKEIEKLVQTKEQYYWLNSLKDNLIGELYFAIYQKNIEKEKNNEKTRRTKNNNI